MAKTTEKKKSLISGNVIKYLYWGSITSLILILFASMQHVQTMYLFVESQAVRESGDFAFTPWTQSLGMEIALVVAAIILALKRRKKEKPEGIYNFGVWSLIFLNFAGNIYAALNSHANLKMVKGILTDDRFLLTVMFLAAGTIPLFAVMLLEYISFFFAQMKSDEFAEKASMERERKKEERQILRERRQQYREAQKLISERNVVAEKNRDRVVDVDEPTSLAGPTWQETEEKKKLKRLDSVQKKIPRKKRQQEEAQQEEEPEEEAIVERLSPLPPDISAGLNNTQPIKRRVPPDEVLRQQFENTRGKSGLSLPVNG